MSKTISEKMEDLEKQTTWFSSEEFKVEEASSRYERVLKLAKEIEQDLAEMKNKIEVLKEDFSK